MNCLSMALASPIKRLLRHILIFNCIFLVGKTDAQNQDSTSIDLKIFCGYGGQTSAEVYTIQQLAISRDYAGLKEKLFSNNKAEVILSTVLIQELAAKRLIDVSAEEINRINSIRSWRYNYSVCYTCTGQFKGKIRKLLKDRLDPVYVLISTTVQNQ